MSYLNNNWYVITGGPSSGKTTVLSELKKRGYEIVDEKAREYIDNEMKKGKTLAEIRIDEKKFQSEILKLKVETETKLPKDTTIFFDRGIPDTIVYYRVRCGILKDDNLEKALKNCSYKKIFVFDILPYEKDYARTETEEIAREIGEALYIAYSKLGMEVIRVPVMSVQDRVKYVLDRL